MGEDRSEAASETNQLVTVQEAAEILGVTVEAVRGRIKRGKLEAQRTEEGLFVLLDTADQAPTGHSRTKTGYQADSDRAADQSKLLEAKDETIQELRECVRRLEDELDVRTEEVRRRDNLLAAALERIPAIEPPSEATGALETPTEEREWSLGHEGETYGTSPQEAEDSLHRGERRSWWRRFFGFE